MKNKILLLAAVFFSFSASAQKDVTLTIKHLLGSSPFAFNQTATNNLNNTLNIGRVDYYMSGFTIIHDGGMQTLVPSETVIFVEGDNNLVASLGTYNVTNVEGIQFGIGVPSEFNTSDPAQWTNNHPLAPKSPSMHWGWASGFRFVALEGLAGSSLNTLYQMHGLWDANYFSQTVMTAGVNSGNDVTINLDADYVEALRGIDVTQGPIDHGANATDLTVLENFRDYVFSPGTGIPLEVSDLEKEINLKIFPNPTTNVVSVSLNNTGTMPITRALVYDLSGKKVNEISLAGKNAADIKFDSKGIYFLSFHSNSIQVAAKKVVVQ